MREFRATTRYVQGPGALSRLRAMLDNMSGDRPAAAIADAHVAKLFGARLKAALPEDTLLVGFSGEITWRAIDEIAARLDSKRPGAVAAVGGGKAIDAGKAVALRLGLPVVSVPTIASTDAPASRGIAIYDEAHTLCEVAQLKDNPQVLVDTEVLIEAPADFLRAGIGDALAKKFEGEAALIGGGLNKHGTRPLRTGLVVADGCYRTLRDFAVQAVADAEIHRLSESFEVTVEACFLMAAIGFENTGLSLAHSLTRGLVTVPEVQDRPHGFHVAYALLVQFAIEDRDEAELADLSSFLFACGLPRSLVELGAAPSPQVLQRIAGLAMTAPHIGNAPLTVNEEVILQALQRIEARATH